VRKWPTRKSPLAPLCILSASSLHPLCILPPLQHAQPPAHNSLPLSLRCQHRGRRRSHGPHQASPGRRDSRASLPISLSRFLFAPRLLSSFSLPPFPALPSLPEALLLGTHSTLMRLALILHSFYIDASCSHSPLSCAHTHLWAKTILATHAHARAPPGRGAGGERESARAREIVLGTMLPKQGRVWDSKALCKLAMSDCVLQVCVFEALTGKKAAEMPHMQNA